MKQSNATTVADFVLEIKDKAQLHEALERHGFFLPSLKSSIATERYLEEVAQGITWCPKYSEIHLKPCPRPPSKDILIEKLILIINEKSL